VARRQLLAGGVTKSMIHTMRASGLLVPRRHGVYAFGHAAPGELTRETEALLVIRARALLSGSSALALWNLAAAPRSSEPVEITVLAPYALKHPGIRTHRTSTLEETDIRIHRGLPVTSPARALVDAAGTTNEFRFERMLDEALHRHLVRLPQLKDALSRAGRTHKGAGVVHAILTDRQQANGLSRSHPELLLRDNLRAAGIPDPDLNANFGQYQPDMVWWEQRVIVEVDSWRWHGSRHSFEADRKRDATLIAQGWTILHFTARQIEREPYRVIAQIAAALAHAA
jgi:very-short-patch-repair endonuclease